MQPADLKPGNAARQHWHAGAQTRTPLALLYLHGFTASPGEAGDLPEQIADALAANLYVHRWPGHGRSAADAMQGLTPAVLQASALDALAQAQRMGARVAIVGSSMGATLGLWLAAQRPDAVAAVIAWSPGIRPADPALLDQVCAAQTPLTDPRPRTAASLAFWSSTIHPDGFRALRSLFDAVAADPPWPRVRCPVFLAITALPTARRIQPPRCRDAGHVRRARQRAGTHLRDGLRYRRTCDRLAAQDPARRYGCAGLHCILARACRPQGRTPMTPYPRERCSCRGFSPHSARRVGRARSARRRSGTGGRAGSDRIHWPTITPPPR